MNQTIMVVDDENIITATLSNLLEMMFDCHVIVYNNPLEALEDELLKEQSVDILITDFMMPHLDGFELIKRVQDIHPKCINILLTGYADKKSAIKSINELNLYYYLEKPWQNDDLVKVIQNGFDKKSLEMAYDNQYVELEKSNLEISRLYALLQNDFKQEIDKNSNLSEWNKELNSAVIERTFALQNILDNVGQGFLLIDDKFLVNPKYSLECVQIFGKDISNISFIELISPVALDEQLFLKDLMSDILDSEDPNEVELLMPLLPDEVMIGGQPIKVEFKLIKKEQWKHVVNAKNRFMVVLTNISKQRDLESQIEVERNKLKMVVAAVVQHHDLVDVLKEYALFNEKTLPNLLNSQLSLEEKINIIFRNIHTFKGSFAQLGLLNTTQNLHKVESEFSQWEQFDLVSLEAFKQWLMQLRLNEVIRKDVQVLDEYLGVGFFKEDELLFVDKNILLSLEFDIMKMFENGEANTILEKLRQLRYKPFKSLLEPLVPYVSRLSEDLNKPMETLRIIGSDVLVDLDIYAGVSKTLVHIIRNAMDHGIESIESRHLLNKPYMGLICCEVTVKNEWISLTITNDGEPIDVNVIKEKAVSLGYDQLELDNMLEDELMMLLFEDKFSTSKAVSLLSGRGIGLSAVLQEVKKLGGSIAIQSDKKETSFIINMPFIEQLLVDQSGFILKLVESLQEKITQQFESNFTTTMVTKDDFRQPFYAMIEVSGGCTLSVSVGLNQPILKALKRLMSLRDIDQEDGLDESILAEFVNTLVGNGLAHLPVNGNLVNISIPKILDDRQLLELNYSQNKSYEMVSELGKLFISVDY